MRPCVRVRARERLPPCVCVCVCNEAEGLKQRQCRCQARSLSLAFRQSTPLVCCLTAILVVSPPHTSIPIIPHTSFVAFLVATHSSYPALI